MSQSCRQRLRALKQLGVCKPKIASLERDGRRSARRLRAQQPIERLIARVIRVRGVPVRQLRLIGGGNPVELGHSDPGPLSE